jgi:hypothetical protein
VFQTIYYFGGNMNTVNIKFALDRTSRIVHINDVANGKLCNCICQKCGFKLIAVQGAKKEHHFRHSTESDCTGGYESLVHLAAKQIIQEKMQIRLPALSVNVTGTDSKGEELKLTQSILKDGKFFRFHTVQPERKINDLVADLVASIKNHSLIIEILYTHAVDEEKLDKIKEAGISAIEIDLSNLREEDLQDWEKFWQAINDPKRSRWLFNITESSIEKKLKKELDENINLQNKKYEEEAIKKHKKEQNEILQLTSKLPQLNHLRSAKHAKQLQDNTNDNAHRVWQRVNHDLSLDWQAFPGYLDIDVKDGDWIFGCDRKIWQAAVYRYIFKVRKKPICTNMINNYLQKTLSLKASVIVSDIGKLGRKHRAHVHESLANDLPSSRRTINSFLEHLSKLNMLMYTDSSFYLRGNRWYNIIRDIPLDASNPSSWIEEYQDCNLIKIRPGEK